MKGLFLIAALVAAPSTNVLAGEVGIAQSGGDRFMLISESVKEYAERDGSRTALVYSYSGGERTLVTFMVDGCSQGNGAVAYGLAGEDYKKAVKTTWTAVGNKVFDRISYNICRQTAMAAQLPQQSPPSAPPQAPASFGRR